MYFVAVKVHDGKTLAHHKKNIGVCVFVCVWFLSSSCPANHKGTCTCVVLETSTTCNFHKIFGWHAVAD